MGAFLFWGILHAVAFSVGGPFGPVVVGAIWYVVAYLPRKRAEEREEARYFEDSNDEDGVFTSTRVDFQEMTMESTLSLPGEEDDVERSLLERKGDGRWRYRLTEESAKEALERYLDRATRLTPDPETEQRLRRNPWRKVSSHFASRLEVAYQQYLRKP